MNDKIETNGTLYLTEDLKNRFPIQDNFNLATPSFNFPNSPIKVTGATISFTGQFISSYYKDESTGEPIINLLSNSMVKMVTFESYTVNGPFGDNNYVYYNVTIPPGCRNFTLTYFSSNVDIRYEAPSDLVIIDNNPSNLTIDGKNIYEPSGLIKNQKMNTPSNAVLTSYNQSLLFESDYLKYCDDWDIILKVCDINYTVKTLYNRPIINEWTPVPSTGGNTTITGKYFANNSTSKPTVKIGTKNCIVYEFYFSNGIDTIICGLEKQQGASDRNLTVFISTSNECFISKPNFYYEQPIISSFIESKYNNTHSILYVTGKYITSDNIKAIFLNPNNSTIEISIFNRTGTTSFYVYSPILAQPGYMKLINYGSEFIVESPNYSNFWLTPSIDYIIGCDTIGGVVTLVGTSLYAFKNDGSTTALLENTNIKIGDNLCLPYQNGDGTYITCILGEGIGGNIETSIQINKYSSSLKFSYNSPSILDTEQDPENNTITLKGNNFGNSDKSCNVGFKNDQGEIKMDIVSIKHNELIVKINDLMFGNYSANITVGPDLLASNSISSVSHFIPILPIITNVTNVDIKGGLVNITGRYLNSNMIVTFIKDASKRKPTPCINIKTFGNLFAQCTVIGKNGQYGNSTTYTSGKNFTVNVVNGDKEAFNKNATFSFNPPIITNSSRITISAFKRSETISISGNNFNRNGLRVFINDVECKYPLISIEFKVLSCGYPSLESLGITAIDYKEWNNKTVKFNVTVDDQTTIYYGNFYNFNQNIIDHSTNYGYLAAVGVCGLVAIATIIVISAHKYSRYKRIKKIEKILHKINNNIEG